MSDWQARRPLAGDEPDGYLESDRDYVENNLDLAVMLLDLQGNLPLIAKDGPVKVNDHRIWMANKLLDSRMDDHEALSTVAFHPLVSDIWEATR